MAVNHDEVREAVMSLGLVGDPDTGILRRFGVILAVNSADFLIGREVDFIHALGEKALKVTEGALIDAAQWCCNATCGGIMASDEWAAVIEPHVSDIHERFDALAAIINCLGWGRMAEYSVDEEKRTLQMKIEHSYYTDIWKERYGISDRPVCYMWTGVAGGYADLLMGRKPHDFVGKETQCAAMGAPHCEFTAQPVKRGIGMI